jgi:RNA 2',3'-cyclic 3'-phosphodiesterase
MRLFVAIIPPADVHERIVRVMEELKPFSRASRWVRPEGLHLTLKFLGDVKEPQLACIAAELKEIRALRPIELRFRGLESFPKHDRPRVIWTGIDVNKELTDLSESMESRLEPLGFPREERDFSPHITLARINSRERLENLARAMAGFASYDFGTMQACEFQLFQSALKPSGAEYASLGTFHFASGEANTEDRKN